MNRRYIRNFIKPLFTAIMTIASYIPCSGQITESFSDGLFERWVGDVDSFYVATPHVTGNGSLDAATDGNVLCSKPGVRRSALFLETNIVYGQWSFSLAKGQGWSVSSTNDYFVVLCSDTDNPAAYKGTLNFNGYYLRHDGSAGHNFILYRQQGTVKTVVLDTGFPEGNDVTASIPRSFRITRTAQGLWSVFIDAGWDKNAVIFRGTAIDNTITSGNFFGLVTNVSSPSDARVLWFDNLYAGTIIIDKTPPAITEAAAITQNQVTVAFSKTVEAGTALNTMNFLLETIGEPLSAVFTSPDCDKIRLEYGENFPMFTPLRLYVSKVTDISANVMRDTSVTVTWTPFQAGDIVINEIYFEQGDNTNMPNYDFIELYNRKDYPVKMDRWRLSIGTRNITFPNCTIPANGYVILTPQAAVEEYSIYGETLGIISTTDLTNPTT